jgi:hypothetical protein
MGVQVLHGNAGLFSDVVFGNTVHIEVKVRRYRG